MPPPGTLECFIEVPFMLGEKRLYPDGLIRVTRGSKSWTALVEVKTGPNQLATEQLENYLDIARENGFDAVITISNEIPAVAGQHPTKVDKRKLKKVALHHVSWSQVLAEAVMQKEFRGVADPDQAWILGELIRYLEHRKSGALEFDDMGEAWVGVRDQVAAGTLRATDKGIAEVVARFDALLRFASLQLGRQLGTEVVPVLSRKEAADPLVRAQALTQSLCTTGQLSGAIRIPDTVGQLVVTADLRAGKVTCHVDVEAPREGRATTRVNWLVRQLKNAPDGTRVEAFVAHARGSQAAELLVDGAGEPRQPRPRPGQGAAVVPGRRHRQPGHEARPRPRIVHRLRAHRRRRVLRRRAGHPASLVRGTAEAAPRQRRAPRHRRHRARSAGLHRLLLAGRHPGGPRQGGFFHDVIRSVGRVQCPPGCCSAAEAD